MVRLDVCQLPPSGSVPLPWGAASRDGVTDAAGSAETAAAKTWLNSAAHMLLSTEPTAPDADRSALSAFVNERGSWAWERKRAGRVSCSR